MSDNDFLPYGRQLIEKDDIEAVTQALNDDYLTTGPRVGQFEAALAGFTGASHAVVCNSGTAALHLANLALGLGPGDQVIVPAITFVATANAARFVGADVVFADVDADTGLMTAETLTDALKLAPRAKAVAPVHLNGSLAPMPEIAAVARASGLFIVEDACHALGTTYSIGRDDGGTISGSAGDNRYSDLTCFSFHPVKAIAMGEGGAVTTNNERLAARMALFRNHGLTRDPGDFVHEDMAYEGGEQAAPWYYELHELGYNYRAPDILCALGTSQLAKLSRFVARRRQLAALYDTALADLAPLVGAVKRPEYCNSAFHLYVAAIDFKQAGISRTDAVAKLRALGVGTQVHYVPVHRQPYYRRHGENAWLAGADAYYDRILSLPLFPSMSDDDVGRVTDALSSVFAN